MLCYQCCVFQFQLHLTFHTSNRPYLVHFQNIFQVNLDFGPYWKREGLGSVVKMSHISYMLLLTDYFKEIFTVIKNEKTQGATNIKI